MSATGSEDGTLTTDDLIGFGPFALDRAQRTLVEGDARIPLGSRAFDILQLLLERAGSFVSKDEIVARVWPRTVVVEGNLRVHVTALRKALRDGRDGRRFIVTVPNRGYSFVAPVARTGVRSSRPAPCDRPVELPGSVTSLHRIVGRDQTIAALLEQVRGSRLVTIVGAGGMGKTTVALSVAGCALADPARSPWTGVHFVDLTPISDGRMVPGAVAGALGLTVREDDCIPNLRAFLHDKALLLLLDNCEQVAGAVAALVEDLLRIAPRLTVLATSREPLRADGECVQRLKPLELPPRGLCPSAADAMGFGSIELFVDRATAALDTFVLQESDVAPVIEICRRLDGIPLAIELAAGYAPILGIRGIEAALENQFLQAVSGRRTALARHRTLQATLDWSHGLSTPAERTVLARLATFRGSFTLESAGAVASDPALPPDEVFNAVIGLADKSLLAVDASDDPATFRMLETTRLYATSRLRESGEMAVVQRRHALHVLALLHEAEAAWSAAQLSAWRLRYGRHVDDVRSAIAWSMADGGDLSLGLRLTVDSAQLLFQLSRADECGRLVMAAKDALERSGASHPRLAFELDLVMGLILPHTHGRHPAAQRALDRALAMAREQGDPRQLGHAITSNWIGAYVRGDPRAMLAFAQEYESLTAGSKEPSTTLLYDWMKAPTLHLLGDQRGARACAERSLAATATARAPFLSGALIDRRVAMGTILARVLWLQGLAERAEDVAARAVERARHEGESVGLAYALAAAACPVALWTGRHELARERVALLLRHTAEHSLSSWRNYGLAYAALLDWHDRGRPGQPELPAAIHPEHRIVQFAELLATLHPNWATQATFERGDRGEAGWCQAELLRLRGERSDDPAAAETLFTAALARARQDGTVAWERRAATSLAQLWTRLGRSREAGDLLASVVREPGVD